MDLYAVVGHPVNHSKSPRIHSLFAKQTAEDIEYTAIQAPLNGFANTVRRFFDHGGKGLNVTVPFKEEAWQLCTKCSKQAQLAGAVNTLWLRDGELCGDNTDGTGLVNDLTLNHKLTLAGKKILVLGAGGAVRGILLPLLQQQPVAVVIANRTVARAERLAQQFAQHGHVRAMAFDLLSNQFDLVINGTSASLEGTIPAVPVNVIGSHTVTCDLMYSSSTLTPFCRWAQASGAGCAIDGLGMLVEQAAEAFFIWRGVRPDTQSVLETLKRGD